ncbi:competence protein ComEA helix-hairpin-helix repeat region [Mucilaginibacter mallensis]|uniref:Competence protein ComEA helix-hairpin-helix repeat region n=1 Tax=Mucilaginibacter mallensis TaxID=652787 RepID=A0A1H2AP46_MUCMA|nr:helix-hairpin-helix domain-containing protein [Mucilaginibacter mallensis]SDT47703.1 competence protein ComEA helix-hairpin-helix repeat region [Mucilaginibacter mallensis]
MKSHIKNYLSVTKKEWNGMVVLVILIALVLLLPYAYQFVRKDSTKINETDFNKAAALLSKAQSDSSAYKTPSDEKIANPVLFDFNPNNLTAAQWKQLGLSEHQIKIIINYTSKGGHFYRNTDLQKIYGITPDDYKRLEPYIDIPQKEEYASTKLKPGATVEVNTADSAQLTEVRGIGPSFAMRIIRYRDRLGGFYQKEQLKDVYGVDSVKYAEIADQLTLNSAAVTKLKINSISFESLRQFPYLTYKQANAVIQYRVQHGNYTSVSNMENIAIITPEILHKIEPYLSFK